MPSNNEQQNKYQAARNNNDEENESSKKAAGVAAKGALNYFTGGKGGQIYDQAKKIPGIGKKLDKAEEKIGKNLNKATGGKFGKVAKKADDVGALDVADKAMSMGAGAPNGVNSTGSTSNQGNLGQSKTSSGNNKQNSNDSSGSNSNSQDKGNKSNYNPLSSDKEGSGIGSFSGLFSLKKKIMIYGILIGGGFFFIIIFGLIVIMTGTTGNSGSQSSNGCTYTSNADQSSKRNARFTTYTGSSLGGSIGPVDQYVREGTIYYDHGLAMWKGGTTSKRNGKVYGQPGVDYMIVAMATRYLFGNCVNKQCTYRWKEENNVVYFNYGDTFTIEISYDGGNTYQLYNAIVLDSCGACMEWSLTASGFYAPYDTNSNEVSRCKISEGYKIDLFRRDSNVTIPSDMGFYMNGNSSNVCVGEVDLGNLVPGLNDTKILQGESISSLYGPEGVNALNNEITNNVNKYGSGTGKGVAAAAITLINSLKQKGYRLPYYWAGGHGAISAGVNPNWGGQAGASCTTGSGRCYYFNSLDCSGFVSWAIKNGGCSNFTSRTSKLFGDIGPKEDIKNVKAGDILVHPGSHVVLVVQNNNGKIVLAESSGGNGGVHFTDYDSSYYANNPNYYFIDMSSFYSSNSCK